MENRIAGAKMTHYYRPQKSNESSDETHSHRHDRPTDMPWLFHFLLHFGANMEKNIASTSLGFPAYLATLPCDNGISCANKGWNLTFAGLCLNSKALSEIICRILYFISYNLYFYNFSIELQS